MKYDEQRTDKWNELTIDVRNSITFNHYFWGERRFKESREDSRKAMTMTQSGDPPDRYFQPNHHFR